MKLNLLKISLMVASFAIAYLVVAALLSCQG